MYHSLFPLSRAALLLLLTTKTFCALWGLRGRSPHRITVKVIKKIFKEGCNNSITLRRKNFFFLVAGVKQKYFSTFFKTQEHFCVLMSLYIWGEKYFLKAQTKYY